MFSYRPGALAVVFNHGTPPISRAAPTLILQVHYNTQFLPAGGADARRQQIAMWTLPAGQLPERVVYRTGVFGPLSG